MRYLRGVGARLSLALALVVAIALGVVYLIVVPSLERRLVDSKERALRAAVPDVLTQLPSDPFKWPDFVDAASYRHGARVVVYEVDAVQPEAAIRVAADSRSSTSADVAEDPLVIRAAETGRTVSGTVDRGGIEYAELAVPVPRRRSNVVMLQLPLADSLANIRLVERRLVLAGLIALAVAIGIGFGGASVFARRIRRLERAADRISHGSFDEPVTDRGSDELGQLAATFDRMRERLRGLDNARREFVVNASHELRTPIFALGGALELLAEEEMDEETRREFVTSMREQMQRLEKLAEELLDLSRLDAGHLHLRPGPVDLARVATELGEEFAPAAQRSGHVLEVEATPASGLADGERVRQIGRGLIENALRHTPPGTRIVVSTACNGDEARLSVRDGGPGIAAGEQSRVFERFYRGQGVRASGSGLGLAIGGELAAKMGGRLVLVPTPAGGAEFALILPRAQAQDDGAA